MKKQFYRNANFLKFLILGLCLPAYSFAQSSISQLSCRVGVIHSDFKDGYAEATFLMDVVARTGHGGESKAFAFQNHHVEVLADGKWLGISWWRNEKLVAESVTVVSVLAEQSRVLIAYNPENQEQQVALDCSTNH